MVRDELQLETYKVDINKKYNKKIIIFLILLSIILIALVTVNIVKDGKLDKKLHMELPDTLKNVVKCKNPRCITSVEQEIVHTFKLVDKEKKVYRCVYCDAEHRIK